MTIFKSLSIKCHLIIIKCKQFYWRYLIMLFLPTSLFAQGDKVHQFVNQDLLYQLMSSTSNTSVDFLFDDDLKEKFRQENLTKYLVYDFEKKNYSLLSFTSKNGKEPSCFLNQGNLIKIGKNQALGVLVLNMNPLKYAAEVKMSKENFNREINTELINIIAPQTTPPNQEDKTLDNNTDAGMPVEKAKENNRSTLLLYGQLTTELELLYLTVNKLDVINAEKYTDLLLELDYSIQSQFTSGTTIYEISKNLVKQYPDSEYVATLANKGLIAYTNLKLIRPYQFFDAVSPGENDKLLVDISINEINPNVTPDKYSKIRDGGKSPIKVNVTGGLKIDGSGGLFITSLIDHNFKNVAETYQDTSFFKTVDFQTTDSITAITEASRNRIEREDNGQFDLSAGALVHFYIRNSRTFNVGLSLGATINTQQTLRYLFGASLLVGRKQRVSFSGGLALGKVKRLATGLEEGQIFTGDASTAFREVNMIGSFLGLSYNF